VSDLHQEFVEQLCATAVRLGGCYSVLVDVLILAREAHRLPEEQVRARLAEVADRAVRELGGGPR
jgi:hypothetical protein